MPSDAGADQESFEQQIRQLLVNVGYERIERADGDDGIANFYAERDTLLGTDSVYVVLDFWQRERVGRAQIEQAAGRMLLQPTKRLIVITKGVFDDFAREYARRVSATLIDGEQLQTLMARAANGAGFTTALEAAAVVSGGSARPEREPAPQPQPVAPSTPPPAAAPTSSRPTGRSAQHRGPVRRRDRARSVPGERQTLSRRAAVGVVLLILLAIAALTYLILQIGNRSTEPTEGVAAPGTTVQLVPLPSGAVVHIIGHTRPSQEVALYRNGLFIGRAWTDEEGQFTFEFVPLVLNRENAFRLNAVTPDGRLGEVLWHREGVRAPFFEQETPMPGE